MFDVVCDAVCDALRDAVCDAVRDAVRADECNAVMVFLSARSKSRHTLEIMYGKYLNTLKLVFEINKFLDTKSVMDKKR